MQSSLDSSRPRNCLTGSIWFKFLWHKRVISRFQGFIPEDKTSKVGRVRQIEDVLLHKLSPWLDRYFLLDVCFPKFLHHSNWDFLTESDPNAWIYILYKTPPTPKRSRTIPNIMLHLFQRSLFLTIYNGFSGSTIAADFTLTTETMTFLTRVDAGILTFMQNIITYNIWHGIKQ